MMSHHHIELLNKNSSHVVAAANLHTRCLPGTITSQRGSATLTGIYRKLLHQDHSIIVAVSGEQIVGGIVVLRASRPSPRWFILLYRPWSWWLAMYRLGLTSFSRQLVDVITLQRSTDSLQPHDYIIAVYVDEDFRGLGIGRDLVRSAIENSQMRHVGLMVDTNSDNSVALSLYRQLGFRDCRQTKLSTMFTLETA
jgi:ribosomal protein S18 acetylase RimI-like enzyme